MIDAEVGAGDNDDTTDAAAANCASAVSRSRAATAAQALAERLDVDLAKLLNELDASAREAESSMASAKHPAYKPVDRRRLMKLVFERASSDDHAANGEASFSTVDTKHTAKA